jgi:hypothetical protein
MGMNAISIYVLAEGGIPDWFLSCFYLDDPDQNLQNVLWPTGVYWGEDEDAWGERSKATYQIVILLWVLGYIGMFMALAAYMHRRRIFIKI